MVHKDDIVVWFSRQPSHQRLDVLCTLVSICLPFELRFVNTCVDFLSKKDAPSTRDVEILAGIEKSCLQLAEVNLHDESSRKKLIWTLTLLHAGNRIVAHTIYRILCNTCADLKVSGPESSLESNQELHLIFTMVLHHPSFTYEEKVKLGEIYLCMQSRLPGRRAGADTASPLPNSYQSPSVSPSPKPQTVQASNGPLETSDRCPNTSNRKSYQNGRGYHHHNHHQHNRTSQESSGNAPRNGSVSGYDLITIKLKEQMGNCILPKAWQAFSNYTPAELMNLTDKQLHDSGLNPKFITRLKKLLHNQCNQKSNGGISQNGGGELSSVTRKKENAAEQHPQPFHAVKPATTTTNPRSAMVKTCMGPPNVQPAFNNSARPAAAESPQEQPTSRAGSSSSTGSSSLETCSPPSSPTESSIHRGENRKHFASAAHTAMHMPQAIVLAGTRPQTRVGSSVLTSSTLRGANNNLSFLRPMTSNVSGGSTNSSRQQPPQMQQQQQQSVNNRASSQSRDMPFSVSLSYSAVQQPQQQPTTAAPFVVDSSTPPPNLEAAAQPALPVYSYHGYLPMTNGDGSATFAQPPFTFIPPGPPPPSSSIGNRQPGPHDIIYPPGSYMVQGQVVAQPVVPHGTNANARPSLMELPYLPPGTYILTTRSETDFSRPPPPGSTQSATLSCFNCGGSGHRGAQCQHTSLEEIIKPAPV